MKFDSHQSHFTSLHLDLRVVVGQTAFCLFIEFLRPPFNLTLSYMEINEISRFFCSLAYFPSFSICCSSISFYCPVTRVLCTYFHEQAESSTTSCRSDDHVKVAKHFPTTFLSCFMTRDLLARDLVIRAGQMFPSLLEHEPIVFCFL